MGRIVGVLSLELIREGKGNYSKKKKRGSKSRDFTASKPVKTVTLNQKG